MARSAKALKSKCSECCEAYSVTKDSSELSCPTCIMTRHREYTDGLRGFRVELREIFGKAPRKKRPKLEAGFDIKEKQHRVVELVRSIASVELELKTLEFNLIGNCGDAEDTQLRELYEKLFTRKEVLESMIKEQQKRIAEQESELTFLRLKLDSDAGHRISEGDVVIIVQDRTEEPLFAHKFVLSSKSSVFCKMFETEMLEKEQGVVRIDDATLETMRAAIKFCYDAKINFTDRVTPEEVLKIAHKYDITLLWKICEENLTATINGRNLAKRLKLAKTLQATNLEAAVSKYFKDNFDSVFPHIVEEL